MKRIPRILILYLLIITYIILVSIIYVNRFNVNISWFLSPLCWLVIWGLALQFRRINPRIRHLNDRVRIVFIIVITYSIINFNIGIITGFVNSPYNHTVLGILQNTWYFIVIILFKEYVRYILLIRSNGKTYLYFIITLIFILTDLNFYQISNHFIDSETTFKYITSILIPTIVRGILLTYLVLIGGYLLSYSYLIPLAVINILLPIFPNIDWFFSALFDLILMIIIYLTINYHYVKLSKRIPKRKIKKDHPIKTVISIVVLLILVGFIVGLYRIMPIAVMSNSMAPLIYRGDIVIVNKINEANIIKLKENDIIEYIQNKQAIIHRIIKIEEQNGERLFTTKGDNNVHPDRLKINHNQIRSVVIFKIPKIGYPAVWFQELIKLVN